MLGADGRKKSGNFLGSGYVILHVSLMYFFLLGGGRASQKCLFLMVKCDLIYLIGSWPRNIKAYLLPLSSYFKNTIRGINTKTVKKAMTTQMNNTD